MEQSLSHGGNIYHAARGESREALDFCDFSASINALGIPPSVQKVLRDSPQHILHYPDPDGIALRQAIARKHKIRPENVVLGNGTTELIYAIPAAFKIRHGLILGPTFSEYETALTLENGIVSMVMAQSMDGYRPPVIQALECLKQLKPSARVSRKNMTRIDAVFLCNPNSPTGQAISRTMVYRLLAEIKEQGQRCIIDETFVDFCEEKSVIHRAVKEDSLLVLRSFTKFFGIPGLRIGYAVGTESLIARLQNRLPPWSVNAIAQAAALACLRDHRYKAKSLIVLHRDRDRFARQLQNIQGLTVYSSAANFLLVEVSEVLTSFYVAAALKKFGILVRDCSNYQGLNNRTIRLAVRTPKENSRLIGLLKKVVEGRG